MVKITLNLVKKTLKAVNVAKQDRITASGNQTGMQLPPTILSQERRPTPSSCAEPEPGLWSGVYASAYMATTMKRAGRLAASRFGFLARRGTSSSTNRLPLGSLALLVTAPVPSTPAAVAGRGRTEVLGRVGSEGRTWHRVHADHDYQSHDQRDVQFQTFTGQQPVHGTTRTLIRGK
jgi:hypothetical protein